MSLKSVSDMIAECVIKCLPHKYNICKADVQIWISPPRQAFKIGELMEILMKQTDRQTAPLTHASLKCQIFQEIDGYMSALSTHQSSSVSFCMPLWVTPSRSSSSWRTRSLASVSLLRTSSRSSDRLCDERSSSLRDREAANHSSGSNMLKFFFCFPP